MSKINNLELVEILWEEGYFIATRPVDDLLSVSWYFYDNSHFLIWYDQKNLVHKVENIDFFVVKILFSNQMVHF